MKIQDLPDLHSANKGANDAEVSALEAELETTFPSVYSDLLKESNGFSLNGGLLVYSTEEVAERNETLEVQEYAPGYLAIGDDSGGQSIMLSLTSCDLFLVDQGSMDPDDMIKLAESLPDWVSSGCKI